MPRRREVPKRKIQPDPKFGSPLLARFVNALMVDGKRSTAERIVYDAIAKFEPQAREFINKKSGKPERDDGDDDEGGRQLKPDCSIVELFDAALSQVRPTVEVRSRRVGGATYQVPVEVGARQSTAKAMRWLINAARKRSEHGMISRLSGELSDALQGRGEAVKKREDTHRMAQANKAFAHFRW